MIRNGLLGLRRVDVDPGCHRCEEAAFKENAAKRGSGSIGRLGRYRFFRVDCLCGQARTGPKNTGAGEFHRSPRTVTRTHIYGTEGTYPGTALQRRIAIGVVHGRRGAEYG